MQDRLGLAPSATGEPPPLDPELIAPLIPGDEFFKTLPERPRGRVSTLAVALLLHAIGLGILLWAERDRLRELNATMAMKKPGAEGRPGAPGEQGVPVFIVPRLPPSLRPAPRPGGPRASAPAASAPQPESDLGRRYTHIVQEEQPDKPPLKGVLFSDHDRQGATPYLPQKSDPRNPDPTSPGRDARRMGISAPGPDRPGEPGSEKPQPEDRAGGGQNGKNGQNGENGREKPGARPPAFGRSGGAIYAPGPVLGGDGGTLRVGRPDSASAPAGDPRGGPLRDPAKGLAAPGAGGSKPGAPDAPGNPGEGEGSGPGPISRQLALARSGQASLFRNPNGGAFKTNAFSFDTQGYDLGDYDRKMHQAVEREWNPPSVPIRLGVAGCTLLRFTIERNGRVSEVELLNTSGTDNYDQAAMSALKNARLPPLPEKMPLERLTGRSGFFINLAESDRCGTPVKPGADDEGVGPGP